MVLQGDNTEVWGYTLTLELSMGLGPYAAGTYYYAHLLMMLELILFYTTHFGDHSWFFTHTVSYLDTDTITFEVLKFLPISNAKKKQQKLDGLHLL